ncbi:MAG: efflux transporter permease subunit [Caulobacter sp.]|nr:efflux transporter permease subunit [Caulobacter sp.]
MTGWLKTHTRSLLFAFVLLAAGGLLAVFNLPVGLFPHIDFPRIAVSVEAGDRPAQEMEAQVIRPLEARLRAIPGVTGLRSTVSRGSGEISVSFNWGSDMVAAALQAEAAVNAAVPDLPAGVVFEVRRMDPTIFPVLGLAITGPVDPVKLRDYADQQMRPLIAASAGVADVQVLGGQQKEFQVVADPARLAPLGLSVEDLTAALTANNQVTGVGRLEDRHRLYLVLSEDRLTTLASIRDSVIKATPAGLVRVGDIAEVRASVAPQWTRATAEGRDAVLVNIRQTPDADSVALIKDIKSKITVLQAQAPAGAKITTFYDQSELVTAAAASVRDSILLGALLAGGVLFFFLRSWRLTLIVALMLPAVLASTALLLGVLNMSLNMMTLGGMAAAVGLVVDDMVVMLEHVMRRLQEARRDPTNGVSAMAGAAEMFRPLVGSTLATIVVFLPLAFLGGVAGGFFKALAVTMSAALVFSLLFSLVVAPVLAERWLRDRDIEQAEKGGRFMERLSAPYRRWLTWLLGRAGLAVAVIAGVLVLAGGLAYTQVQTGFMPKMDEGGFVLDYVAPPGMSLPETDRLLRQVEAVIRSTPDVESYSRRTGLALGGTFTEANEGDFFVKLKTGKRRGIEKVMTDIRGRIAAETPGLEIETIQLMEDLIGDLTAVPQPIEVKLFGNDPAVLAQLAPTVAKKLEGVKGLIEVVDGERPAGDALVITTRREAAAVEGLTPQAISSQVATLIGGTEASQVSEGEKRVGIRVWTPPALRNRVESYGRLLLRAPDGHMLPLSRVADITIAQGQAQIMRENLQPFVPVTGRLQGRDMGSAMRDVRAAMATVALPSGVRVEYGGLYAEQQKSFQGLALVFAAAVFLVSLLLLFYFESFVAVAGVVSVVLLSALSVFVGLWVTGTELDISAMMGLTMVLGIVGELGIFYLAELKSVQQAGAAELIEAGAARLRPILMSALIAILALSPLALGLGRGSELQRPLAIAIIAGLLAGVPLVLFALPTLIAALRGMSRRREASPRSPGDPS